MLALKIVSVFVLSLSLSSGSVLRSEGPETKAVSTNPNDVGFYLYSNPSNPKEEQELVFNDIKSIENSNFDPSKKTIIYSSGFLQNRTTDQAIKDAYLRAGFGSNSNIIIVDWGKLSGNTNPPQNELQVILVYATAKDNVETVGKRLQEMISFLISNGKARAEDIHLVGQSLGAHVSGMAGFYYKAATGGQLLARITGTDAAAQLYQNVHIDRRLDATDAVLVDSIHTNDGGYGYSGAYAKADFFVNGGKAPQPGCDGSEGFCSHNMAVTFFAKSIIDQSLRAYDCKIDTCNDNAVTIPFGQYCPTSASGSFYIDTSPDY